MHSSAPATSETSLTGFGEGSGSPPAIDLELLITDPETCAALAARPDGRTRLDFAIGALRIGVLAIQQAQGRVDADVVRNEGEAIVEKLRHLLLEHQSTASQKLTSTMAEYFDPASGRFTERVDRLIRRDGELEQVLRQQIGIDGSELARTLTMHLGAQSPLMLALDPQAASGIIETMSSVVEGTLTEQRDTILREFSLDNKEGALSRLVSELTTRHGEVGEALEKRIDEVVAEFSLDREDSALSRLIRRVEQAQGQISREFSLDQEGSALARMRRDLLQVIEAERQASAHFQQEVLQKLTDMTARREEAARSTRHGETFEAAVFEFIDTRSQKAGDLATRTGQTTGLIKNCKKGDAVVQLGPDHAAAGARVVVEAKEDASCTLEKALGELDEARKNRDAGVGLFVFSTKVAPKGLEPLFRYGNDVVVAWDADDPRTDVILLAGLSVAKALCARARACEDAETADFEAVERAILEIEKQVGGLDDISRSAETIKSGGEKILARTRIMRDAIANQIAVLTDKVHTLRASAVASNTGLAPEVQGQE